MMSIIKGVAVGIICANVFLALWYHNGHSAFGWGISVLLYLVVMAQASQIEQLKNK